MSAHDSLGPQFVSHVELAKAYSSDWPGHITEFPHHAREAWKEGDLAETRAANYDDYGGPEGWAKRVGGHRTDDKYDEHAGPVQLSNDDGEMTVYTHHRAYDAIQRKVKRIPVEWV